MLEYLTKNVDIKIKNIAVLVFNDVELMDFCGPYDVFSMANKVKNDKGFNIFTVSEKKGMVMTQNGLSINSDYSIYDCPQIDMLIIPGGQGSRTEMSNEKLLNWINGYYPKLKMVLSVCTGALLLANCGLLNGLRATTHHNAVDLLRRISPNTTIVTNKRFIDNGKIVLSAGVSSGIDMSLYVLEKLLGEQLVLKVKENMEYDWMS
nr:DJ-1/PfpI family protein [Clostridium oryzae]